MMKTRRGALLLLVLVATTPAWGRWSQRCLAEMRQTARVTDLNPGTADAAKIQFGFSRRDEYMAAYQDALYFQGNDGHTGSELWRVSKGGTPSQVVNLAPGAQSSTPHAFVVFQNRLYFAASTPATGEELYRYNGQTVTLAAETVAGATGAEIFSTVVYGNAIYFTRREPPDGHLQVWRFDGKTAKLVPAIDSIAGSVHDSNTIASPFAVFDGKLYFVGGHPPYELWSFDGSTVSMIKALAFGLHISYEMNLTVFEDKLYFSVVTPKDAPFQQDELWQYDGKEAPAQVFVFPGDAHSFSQPNDYAVYKGKLYFSSRRWWRYDGVTVTQVTGQLPSIGQTSRFDSADRLFFSGFYDNSEDKEPYLFDGTTPTLVKNIMPQDASAGPGSLPSRAVEVNDELYFYAVDDTHGRELWRTSAATSVLQHRRCDIVLVPIREEWERWPPPLHELVVATWVIGGRGRRLISREVVTVTPDREIRVRGLEVKEGFVLATVAFDRKTGRIVDGGFDVIGRLDPHVRRSLERAAAGLVKRSTLREVMSESIERQ